MLSLLDLRAGSVQAYVNAAQMLNSKGDMRVEFGLFTIECSKLALECTAVAEEMVALSAPSSGEEALKKRAELLFAAAMKFQSQIGPNTLIIPEVYDSKKITGIQKASVLMAEGNENMAESVAMKDPKKAAEYFHMALNYRRQIGDSAAETRINDKIKQYSKAAACWICGREVTGETIHFVSMPTEITPLQSTCKQSSPLPSSNDSISIYVCRACYLAIHKRADQVARQYYDAAMREMAAMESRLNARINAANIRIR
jgi:hypothetical protein